MEFVAGLIVGTFVGISSWLALAAWMEGQRARLGINTWEENSSTTGFDRLSEGRSHA